MQGKVGGEGLAWERDNISDNIGQYSAGQYRAGREGEGGQAYSLLGHWFGPFNFHNRIFGMGKLPTDAIIYANKIPPYVAMWGSVC